jgi:hypothetical protein
LLITLIRVFITRDVTCAEDVKDERRRW